MSTTEYITYINEEIVNLDELLTVKNAEKIIGDLNQSKMFFKSDKLYEEIIPKSKDAKVLRGLLLGKAEDWICIGEAHRRAPDRGPIVNGKRVGMNIYLYTFQNIKTLEICKNSPVDGGGGKSDDETLNLFTSLNTLNYARLYIEHRLNEPFNHFIDVKNADYSILNTVKLSKKELSKFGEDFAAIIRLKEIRESNFINIIFPIMYGPNKVKSLEGAYCLITKVPLLVDLFNRKIFEYSLHHPHTKGNESVLKLKDKKTGMKIEPSTSVNLPDLINYINLLKDIMNTQLISNGIHKVVHNSGVKYQGFNMYSYNQLPYIARSKENYEEVILFLGFKLSDFDTYEDYYNKNCNELTAKEDYHKDRVILSKEESEEITWIDKHKAGKIFGGIKGDSFKNYFYLPQYGVLDNVRKGFGESYETLYCESDVKKAYEEYYAEYYAA